MSCTACEAILKLSKSHTCPGGATASLMGRRLALAAAALPQIIAASPVHVLHAGELEAKHLDEICQKSFLIADAMLRAEGEAGGPLHELYVHNLERAATEMFLVLHKAYDCIHQEVPGSGALRDEILGVVGRAEAAGVSR